MFATLEQINARPRPFEFYTAADLWADEHTSARMLAYHLNEEIDVSSRKKEFIQRSVAWISQRFQVGPQTRVADFGCGPGLYAQGLAQGGARVTGIDFSPRSIEYARQQAREQGLAIDYVGQNYLEYQSPEAFDLIIMIMCDFCALSPGQRQTMLAKFHGMLKPGGAVLLDVYSLTAFSQRQENASYQMNLLDGFWSPGPYYGFANTFKYEPEKVVLDKYTIVEPARTRTVYNWLQYFSPEALAREVEASGLTVRETHANVAGDAFDPQASEFAVVLGLAWLLQGSTTPKSQ